MRVGVFDSGVGGITVLTELMRGLSGQTFVYIGDNANLPYGTKSVHQLRRILASQASLLQDLNLSLLVVACNTASSLVLEDIKSLLPGVPVIGVLEPGILAAKKAIEALPHTAPVVLLATRATVRSQKYAEVWETLRSPHPFVSKACPLLVPLIEEGWWEHQALDACLKSYLEPEETLPGVYLLGCTHYPWISQVLQKSAPGWKIVDAAQEVLALVSTLVSQTDQETSLEWHFSDPTALPPVLWSRIQATLPTHKCIVPVSENTL